MSVSYHLICQPKWGWLESWAASNMRSPLSSSWGAWLGIRGVHLSPSARPVCLLMPALLWFLVSCFCGAFMFLVVYFYFCFLVVCFPVWEKKNIKLVDREVGRIWEKSEKKKTNRNVLFEKFFSWKSLLTVSLSDRSPYYSSCARSDFKGRMVRLF